jgi:OmpR-family two-component system manganese-sensing sensor histidine kinase
MPFFRLASRSLERNLILSYLAAFAVVIVVFTIAVRVSFRSIVQQHIGGRLETLARAGTAAVDFTPNGYIIDQRTLGGFKVNTAVEGLQWFDAEKRLKTSRGLIPQRSVPPVLGRHQLSADSTVLDTYTVAITDLQGKVRGYVRAGETLNEMYRGGSALDLGLAVGAILAIAAATLGGTILASAVVREREEAYQRLHEFTADASHELRTPLAALATTAEVALREAPALPATTQHRLTTIVSLTGQMRRLVDDLLILVRAGKSLEREMFVVPLDVMLQRVNDAYGPLAAEKSLSLSIEHCREIEVFGNPDQLERIVANLVENAIRYTKPGGMLDVSCAYDAASVRIAVRDTGVGIPAEYRERIFDRFWRGGNVRGGDGGSGLGLAIARALARRHGGEIGVTSVPGRGSVFTLTLPRRPPSFN